MPHRGSNHSAGDPLVDDRGTFIVALSLTGYPAIQAAVFGDELESNRLLPPCLVSVGFSHVADEATCAMTAFLDPQVRALAWLRAPAP